MRHPGGLAILAGYVLLLTLLTACTSGLVQDTPPKRSASSAPSDLTRTPEPSAVPPVLACQEPSSDVLRWATEAIAAHPGPVRASTLIRAATTDTGTWYVVGVDRSHVMDDGTPTGDASRSLALTNAVSTVADRSMIPIGEGTVPGDLRMSWDRVAWTGETLAAGQRAARRAVECLESEAQGR